MERRKAVVIAASVATTTAGAAGVIAVNAGLIGATQAHAADKVGQLDARNVSTLLPAKPSKPRVVLRRSRALPPQVTIKYEDVPAPTAPTAPTATRPPSPRAGVTPAGAGARSAPSGPIPPSVGSRATAPAPASAPARTAVPTTQAPRAVVHTGASSAAPSGSHEDDDATPEVEHNDD